MSILQNNLVEITEKEYNMIFDIVYSTKNNFVKTAVYKTDCKVYLHKQAAKKLKNASELANNLGYTIKIYDCFRPLEIQKFFFDKFCDENYITNPVTGLATHTRGIAVDCSLVDKNNKELDFGTSFDDFDEKSHQGTDKISIEAQKNRVILSGIMAVSGFELFITEWWHFQLPNINDYPKLTQKEANVDMISKTLMIIL